MSFARTAQHTAEIDLAAALRAGANVAALVRDVADRHGVSPAASPLDAFAHAVARLSDAEVQTDETEDLLVALVRAGVITSAESMALQAAHLRQTAG